MAVVVDGQKNCVFRKDIDLSRQASPKVTDLSTTKNTPSLSTEIIYPPGIPRLLTSSKRRQWKREHSRCFAPALLIQTVPISTHRKSQWVRHSTSHQEANVWCHYHWLGFDPNRRWVRLYKVSGQHSHRPWVADWAVAEEIGLLPWNDNDGWDFIRSISKEGRQQW